MSVDISWTVALPGPAFASGDLADERFARIGKRVRPMGQWRGRAQNAG